MKKERIEAEYERLKSLLEKAEVPQQQQDVLEPVLDNLAWQRIKLDETRDAIKDSVVAIPYNNGGGQKGVRENPIFKGYVNLWRAYMIGLEKLTSYLPKDMQDEAAGNAFSVLEQVKALKKG